MIDQTAAFFEGLGRRPHEPMLEEAAGVIRFEMFEDGLVETWRVTIDHGDIAVEQGGGDADCVVRAQRRVFDAVATGQANAMAAVLRGAVDVEGNPELLVRFQRLLPAPPGRRREPTAAGDGSAGP